MKKRLVDQKYDDLDNGAIQNNATASTTVLRAGLDLLQDGGLSLKRVPKIEYTPAGYTFEVHSIQLEKVLGCSITPKVKDNITWATQQKFMAYTMQNILVIEDLNIEKT